MRRKFKKAVTLLASLTISVSQIRTPAMAADIAKEEHREIVNPDETIDTNNGEIDLNYGTVKDNNSNIGENKGTVKDNNGSVKTNNGTINTNHENAEVGVNTGEIDTNEGLVGSDNRNTTINHGTIDKNETHLETNAGKNDTEKLDWNDEQKAAYTGGTIKNNNSDVSTNNGTINSNNKKGSVEDNNSTIKDNYGSVTNNNESGIIESNYGTVTDNNNGAVIDDNQGTVANNYGKINENNSEVSDNFGEVTENNGEIENNDEGGYVKQNLGTIGTNDNGGLVGKNYGSIDENGEEGRVSINLGNIEQNNGLVGRYSEGLDPNNLTSQDVDIYVPSGLGNFGEITDNDGIITKNAGINDAVHAGLSEEELEYFEGGNVGTNTGLIIINNGTVETNEETGLIFENSGTVNENTATVTINTTSGTVTNYEGGVVEKNNGIVANHEGGVVEENTGKVYNYGGIIKDKSTGTEYFSVSIASGKNMSKSGGSNLVSYEDDLWLGQIGNSQSYTEIIITPFSDYAISTIKIPNSLKDNVTISRNQNGSWTIRVTSGTNISLSIPNAVYVASSDDSGDHGEKSQPGKNNSDNKNNPVPGPDQKGTLSVTDNFGNTLNVDLSLIIKSLPDKTTAMNTIFSTPMSLKLNQIQGYGTISLKKLFEASPTSKTISVPVAANVKAGTTYKVYFSNGYSTEIDCSQDGLLSMTFENGSSDLTFIIYGTALTPPTGNESSEPSGPSASTETGSNAGPVSVNHIGTPDAPGQQAMNNSEQQNDINLFPIGPVTLEADGGDLAFKDDANYYFNQSKPNNAETAGTNFNYAAVEYQTNTFSVSPDELQRIENNIKNTISQPQSVQLDPDTSQAIDNAQQKNPENFLTYDEQAQTSQAKSLSETRASAISFTNAGADILAAQGLQQAAAAAALEKASSSDGSIINSNNGGDTPFASFSGGSLRAETG